MAQLEASASAADTKDEKMLQTPPRSAKPRPLPLDLLQTKSQAWPALNLEFEITTAARTLQSRPTSELRVVTWNVWFDAMCAAERQLALMREVLAVAPDVACFQEVVPAFLQALRNCVPLATVYEISPYDIRDYGCVMLVRRDFCPKFQIQELPSAMGRSLLSIVCTSRCPGLVVMTAHLESLNSRRMRREQLLRAAAALEEHTRSILCGDFNFDETQTWGDWRRDFRDGPAHGPGELENEVLHEVLPQFSDTWRELWPNDPGYTFDGKLNGACVSDSQERMRYDRVLARSAPGGLVPKTAKLLGMDPINDWDVRPSDHFGLSVDLECA